MSEDRPLEVIEADIETLLGKFDELRVLASRDERIDMEVVDHELRELLAYLRQSQRTRSPVAPVTET